MAGNSYPVFVNIAPFQHLFYRRDYTLDRGYTRITKFVYDIGFKYKKPEI